MTERKRGRPTKHTKALAETICKRLANGESLTRICRDDDMPPRTTVAQWAIDDQNGFSVQYAISRDIGNDVMAESLFDFVDDEKGDVARDRLKFDARRWYLSKLAPKRYGDRLAVEHDVSDNIADQIWEARRRVGQDD